MMQITPDCTGLIDSKWDLIKIKKTIPTDSSGEASA